MSPPSPQQQPMKPAAPLQQRKQQAVEKEAPAGRAVKQSISGRRISIPNRNYDDLEAITPPDKKETVKWINRTLDMGIAGLKAEYNELRQYTLPTMTVDAFKANHEAGKNRYQDVACQDQNRVILKWPGCPTDYIHANYVATSQNPQRFICTQGPLECTVTEFWTMVIQEESAVIVMLCNVTECFKPKCFQYWPENVGDKLKISSPFIEITNMEVTVFPNEPSIKRSTMRIKYTNLKGVPIDRIIFHFQWIDWPDRGVPESKLTAIELLSCIRGSKKPIIVHCSAGIGRTGSIVTIEHILQRLQAGEECLDDLLKQLRHQRAFSIQTDVQYFFVHRIILMYFLEKNAGSYEFLLEYGDTKQKYAAFVQDYKKATGNQ